MKPLAILGLDPGTTSAYAILDLEGKILKVHSSKNQPVGTVISQVIEVALPVIIGTDKAKLPSFVEECARKLGTEVVIPPEDLKKEEKRELIERYAKLPDDHQKDCLAAACYAYKKYQPRLAKIQRYFLEHHISKEQEFVRLALKEDWPFPIIEQILKEQRKQPEEEDVPEQRITQKQLQSIYHRYKGLRERNIFLEKEVLTFQKKIRSASVLLKKAASKDRNFSAAVSKASTFKEQRLRQKEEAIRKLQGEMLKLQQQVISLHRFIGKSLQFQIVKKLPTLGQNDFWGRIGLLYIQPHDVLLVHNPSQWSRQVLEELKGKGIILLSGRPFPKEIASLFVTAVLEPSWVMENDFFALLEKGVVERHLRENNVLEQVVKEYQEERENTW